MAKTQQAVSMRCLELAETRPLTTLEEMAEVGQVAVFLEKAMAVLAEMADELLTLMATVGNGDRQSYPESCMETGK
jgi:hypothetical protein